MFKKMVALVLTGAFLFVGVNSAFAYEVKSGDTMNVIAKSNNLSLRELQGLNPQVKNVNLIYVGQNIKTNKDNSQGSERVPNVSQGVLNYSEYEKDLLARLIRAEAEAEPYAGKVAVGYVVLNR